MYSLYEITKHFRNERIPFLKTLGCTQFLCLFLFTIHTLSAQNLKVIDALSGLPISDVNIQASQKEKLYITGARGTVFLEDMEVSDSLIFSHASYQTRTLSYNQLAFMSFEIRMEEKTVVLPEFLVSISKFKESIRKTSHQADVISASRVLFTNAPTTAEVLEQTGNIFVQRSQMGGGSPVLRGFEANKVLIVVDGVRMNNAIYRSGHLQNVITIDQAVLERTEVIHGPGSLIYGSDALGGVMHFYTRNPELSLHDSLHTTGQAYMRFASSNLEKTGHFSINLGGKRVASLTSATFRDFGDLRMGSRQNPFYEDYGKRFFYADRMDGKDVQIKNPNPLIQRGTAYRQWDILQKLLIDIHPNAELVLNFQYSNSSDVPRYDQLFRTRTVSRIDTINQVIQQDTILYLTDTVSEERLRFAEWDYGPQTRYFLSAGLYLRNGSRAYNQGTIIVAYQRILEERKDRRFGSPIRTQRLETVDVFTLNADFTKRLGNRNFLYYGFEGNFNDVRSTAHTENIETGSRGVATTRYPEDGNEYHTYAAYLKYDIDIHKKVRLGTGFRYSHLLLNSRFTDTEFITFDFSEVSIRTFAMVGSFNVVINPNPQWTIRTMASSGFRAPNVDDVGKIFQPVPGIVVVPNDQLKPEYVYNLEFSVSKRWQSKAEIQATAFNTIVRNAILRKDFSFNNQDSILFDGELSRVQANVNVGQAVIRGFHVSAWAELYSFLSISSSITYTYGRDQTEKTPLAHIPPAFGQSSLMFTKGSWKAEGFIRYQAWKRLKNYSPSSEDRLEDATPFGMPSWYTLNVRMGYQVNDHWRLQVAVENLLDQRYRLFASGINMPGINAIVMLRYQF